MKYALLIALATAFLIAAPPSGFSPAEEAEGFRPIFNGQDLTGWHPWRPEAAKGEWGVADGCITPTGRPRELASDAVYGDFEFRFEWKIAPGGNSGVIYRTEKGYHAPTSGPEFQLLDEEHHAERNIPERSTGAAYAIYGPGQRDIKPAGEWNTARIVARGDHIEHWLNDRKVLEYELHTEDWKKRVAAGKFAKHPQYGAAKQGHIILQDHGAPVFFRNLRIKTLSGE